MTGLRSKRMQKSGITAKLGKTTPGRPSKKTKLPFQKRWTVVLMISVLCTALWIAPQRGTALEDFDATLSIGVEAERKTCTNCDEEERKNEIETTPVELVLRSKKRPDLSFGFEFEYDIESEGDFFGPGRSDVEEESTFSFWARQQLSETYWARAQGEWNVREEYFDLGARIGFEFELENDRELSGHVNLDRRIKTTSDSDADEGTFVEVQVEHEWDWDKYGAWVEVRADHWFYSGDARDETRLTLQPGVWFDLGDSPHRGVVWLEGERRTRSGPDNFKRDTTLLGLGVEFDLGKRRELFVGATFGKERESETGSGVMHTRVQGLLVEFQTRF